MAETLKIELDYDALKNEVKKHLSAIGKRQTDKQGNTLFAGVTLSSAEEALMEHYIKAGAGMFAGEIPEKTSTYLIDGKIELTVYSSRVNEGCKDAFEENFKGYIIAYTLFSTIGMNYAELAKKYSDDMTRHIVAAVMLISTKDAPGTSAKSIDDVRGKMYNDDGTPFNEKEGQV